MYNMIKLLPPMSGPIVQEVIHSVQYDKVASSDVWSNSAGGHPQCTI